MERKRQGVSSSDPGGRPARNAGESTKVLLVNPPTGFSYRILGVSRPPLGLAYMAAILRDHCDVKIVDFSVESRGWSKYEYGEYDLVGVSADTMRYPTAVEIARCAKQQGAQVVMGGPHVSFMDGEALETGVVDYVIRNEGEYALLSLVEYLEGKRDLEDVTGVSYLADGVVRRTPDAPFIADLDSIPFPARDLLPMKLYKEKMNGRLMTTVVTSRGCPFKCDFCSSSRFFGVRWRARSVDNILAEVEHLYRDYGYRAVSFVDDNFTLDPDRAMELSEKVIAKGWDLIWAAMTRVDTIVKNPQLVRTMARAGFSWTFIGFESGSQEALDAYGKKAEVTDAFKAMDILTENGVEVTGAFILGAPDETRQMMMETIEFAKRLNPRRAQFSVLTPYPGSKTYERMEDRLLTRDWSLYSGLEPIIDMDHVTPEEMRKIQIAAYSSFYGRPRKAIQNLSYVRRALPSAVGFLTLWSLAFLAGIGYYPIAQVRRGLAGAYRLIS
jgi:anaerobic magnesium-protoporphyrin IX monomethyl ester cyclase